MLRKITALALCSLTLMALSAPQARPALAAPASLSFTVNSTLDEVDDHPGNGQCHTNPISPAAGACTLRAAVMEADATSGAGATIILPAGTYSLTISAAGGDDASTGDLNLTTPPAGNPLITLAGAGAASTIIDANQLDRVLSVEMTRTANISGVTLRGGFVSGFGGGLYNSGALTVTHSTISGNQNHDFGGGVYNFGELNLIESTISGNSATAGDGGGVFNFGSLLVERSTIDSNHALKGGGVYNFATSLILVNSTLSENYSVEDGGGIYNAGDANIYSTTIAGNWADSDRTSSGLGGGVFNVPSYTFNLRNSLIVGNNLGNTPQWDDCNGTLHAYGVDFVGLESEPDACTLIDSSGGVWYKLNSLSLLGGLQDNGGPTQTVALLAGSTAIMDGGPPVSCTDQNAAPLATDQRGAVRVLGGSCDIGAFEFLPPAAYLPLMRR